MQIATVNVNGIRAAYRKGMGEWLAQVQPDLLLMQEVRADEEITEGLLEGYSCEVWPCRIKGRAGVAMAVREGSGLTISDVSRGVALPGTDEPDVDSGRWLEATVTGGELGARKLRAVSAYLHSGTVGTEKMDQKYAHLALVDQTMKRLIADEELALVCGDFNIVHTEKDIKNWKPNHNKVAGVLDEEIAHLDKWEADGWVDAQRRLSPDTQGPYTWWSNRGKAFDNDAGWRIDYHYVTPSLAEYLTEFSIHRADSYAERWSDHAPLSILLTLH
ncbi:exodeoxyribonuclease III [Actinomyces vulturis]|uniref:exodeoxyribonuclease III n=1 Tax=Actinomyces vulturis TaxID=1857645 RepID=UPI00082D4ACB|nr:exodeoxyribonuclease III [Actinomyces vulturis]